MIGKQTMTKALWVSANFRWQKHRSQVRSQVQARVQVTTVQHLMKLLRGSSRKEGKQANM